jgi:hypothetical protein
VLDEEAIGVVEAFPERRLVDEDVGRPQVERTDDRRFVSGVERAGRGAAQERLARREERRRRIGHLAVERRRERAHGDERGKRIGSSKRNGSSISSTTRRFGCSCSAADSSVWRTMRASSRYDGTRNTSGSAGPSWHASSALRSSGRCEQRRCR